MKKRITINVNDDIDRIKERIAKDSGITVTYVQTFDFLIAFYLKHANVPKTTWSPLK
jgi:hypothetical protein